MRVQGAQPSGPRLDLEPTLIDGVEQHLPLQVGQGHDVLVDQAQHADTRRRQIQGRRASDAARADDQHPRAGQPLLSRPADLAQHQMAGVAFDFVRGEGHPSS